MKAALQAAGGQIHHEFDNLSAIAVTLPQPALAGIERNPSVTLVEVDPPRYPLGETMPYGVPMVQAPSVSADGNHATQGAGITVGVIDSGVFGDPACLRRCGPRLERIPLRLQAHLAYCGRCNRQALHAASLDPLCDQPRCLDVLDQVAQVSIGRIAPFGRAHGMPNHVEIAVEDA